MENLAILRLEDLWIRGLPRIYFLHPTGSDAVYAFRKFQTGIDQYAEVFKSRNGERIWNFSNSISQKLGTAPEQKEQMSKNAKFTDFSPSF